MAKPKKAPTKKKPVAKRSAQPAAPPDVKPARALKPVIVRGHPGEADGLAIAPDGTAAVSTDWRETVCVTELPSGRVRVFSEMLPGRITTAGFLDDGRAIVSGWSGTALVFDARDPEGTRVDVSLANRRVWHLTASRVAPRFAVVAGDSRRDTVTVYELEGATAREVFSIDRAATPCFLADGTLGVLRNIAEDGPEAEINPHSIGSLGVLPHWRVERYDPEGRVLSSLERVGGVLGAHPTEPRVLLAENAHHALGVVSVTDGAGPSVDLWYAPRTSPSPLGAHACFSSDGSFVFAASFDALVVASSDGARRVRYERAHTQNIADLAATPDGRTLVTASWDKTVRLWDVAALCAGAVG